MSTQIPKKSTTYSKLLENFELLKGLIAKGNQQIESAETFQPEIIEAWSNFPTQVRDFNTDLRQFHKGLVDPHPRDMAQQASELQEVAASPPDILDLATKNNPQPKDILQGIADSINQSLLEFQKKQLQFFKKQLENLFEVKTLEAFIKTLEQYKRKLNPKYSNYPPQLGLIDIQAKLINATDKESVAEKMIAAIGVLIIEAKDRIITLQMAGEPRQNESGPARLQRGLLRQQELKTRKKKLKEKIKADVKVCKDQIAVLEMPNFFNLHPISIEEQKANDKKKKDYRDKIDNLIKEYQENLHKEIKSLAQAFPEGVLAEKQPLEQTLYDDVTAEVEKLKKFRGQLLQTCDNYYGMKVRVQAFRRPFLGPDETNGYTTHHEEIEAAKQSPSQTEFNLREKVAQKWRLFIYDLRSTYQVEALGHRIEWLPTFLGATDPIRFQQLDVLHLIISRVTDSVLAGTISAAKGDAIILAAIDAVMQQLPQKGSELKRIMEDQKIRAMDDLRNPQKIPIVKNDFTSQEEIADYIRKNVDTKNLKDHPTEAGEVLKKLFNLDKLLPGPKNTE